jgi:hypothetical protein
MSEEKKTQQQPVDEREKAWTPRKDNPIVNLINGQRVQLILRGGAGVIGQICAYKAGMINLRDVWINSPDFGGKVPWLLVDRSSILLIIPITEEGEIAQGNYERAGA